jgi:transposase
VPPKMTAEQRRIARTRGKSDPIDAVAVARAALREPGLPAASHDEASRELKLLVDRRQDLLRHRTATINRLRGPNPAVLESGYHVLHVTNRGSRLRAVFAQVWLLGSADCTPRRYTCGNVYRLLNPR